MIDDDHTIVRVQAGARRDGSPVPITVRFLAEGRERVLQFTRPFKIGRGSACQVVVDDDGVSRQHVAIEYEDGHWWARDLNSLNGTYLNGKRIEKALLTGRSQLHLAWEGFGLWLEVEEEASPETVVSTTSATEFAKRYLESSHPGEMGAHTMIVRRAFQKAAKKQSRRYLVIIGMAGVLLAGAVTVLVYQQLRLQQLRELTVDIFYNMKALELQLARVEEQVRETGEPDQIAQLSTMRTELSGAQGRYDAFLEKLDVYSGISEEDKLILHVARVFGECELNMPVGFASEVKTYIEEWKATGRLARAVKRAQRRRYVPIVREIMLEHDLPPEFLYLALQESNFEPTIIGPKTRHGIAKGVWQFIPRTARRYGLTLGPLSEVPVYDLHDERFDFRKATAAAARYLRDIYTTEAQASGLLVMASYNWGEHRVNPLIRKMPENPRERNFWELLTKYRIPKETHDYVFRIFSAAVIGENPRLFGFDFDNPLATSESKLGRHAPFPPQSVSVAAGPST